jgi:DNA-binding MarR family transcriptional regulator
MNIPLDLEARAHSEHAQSLRLWLRLLTCSQLIEKRVRAGLREQFDTTLPRFDVLAQLDKMPDGMTLGELSQRMMVTNGNVTGLVDRLVAEGLIARRASPKDRRVQIVKLTAAGRRTFRGMARANGNWISDIFAGLDANDIEAMMQLLAKTKASAGKVIAAGEPNGRR